MVLSKNERLILANQYRILAQVDPENAKEYEQFVRALEEGFSGAYPSLNEEELSDEDTRFVWACFNLHAAMQQSLAQVGPNSDVKEEDVTFDGFDGNNETTLMSYAKFEQEQLGNWSFVKTGRDGLNSHMPSVEMYKRMLKAWDRFERPVVMTLDELKAVINARRFPER